MSNDTLLPPAATGHGPTGHPRPWWIPTAVALGMFTSLLGNAIGGIYREQIAGACKWPFHAGVLAAFLAFIPALLTGRRPGEQSGDHELTRMERRADFDARAGLPQESGR